MAKKFGKFLLFSAVVSAAAAGVYYYLQNRHPDDFDFEDEDWDDTEDAGAQDLEDTDAPERSYVDLDLKAADANATPAPQAETVVEEFFNDET